MHKEAPKHLLLRISNFYAHFPEYLTNIIYIMSYMHYNMSDYYNRRKKKH